MDTLVTQDNRIAFISVTETLDRLGIRVAPGYLMNRQTLGIPLRAALARELRSLANATLVVDLADVSEMTTSVAEEIGPLLFREFMALRLQKENIYLTYCNVSKEIARGLDAAFKNVAVESETSHRQNIVVFSTFQNGIFAGPQFLGQEIPSALKEILDVVYRFNEITSSTLEAQGIKAASRKLTDLAKFYPWLFRKSQKMLDMDSRAWAYFYSAIVPIVK